MKNEGGEGSTWYLHLKSSLEVLQELEGNWEGVGKGLLLETQQLKPPRAPLQEGPDLGVAPPPYLLQLQEVWDRERERKEPPVRPTAEGNQKLVTSALTYWALGSRGTEGALGARPWEGQCGGEAQAWGKREGRATDVVTSRVTLSLPLNLLWPPRHEGETGW